MEANLQKEQFSHAYVRAVASVAGFGVTRPEIDDDSVDLSIAGRIIDNIPCRPRLELQLKCTSGDITHGDEVLFPLGRKNYDELRITNIIVPRLLVVVIVPEVVDDWLSQSEAEMTMKRCGYWVSLWDWPPKENVRTITIHLPRSQVFDVATLKHLMRTASSGEPR